MADKGWTKYQDEIEVAELGKAYDEAIAELSTARDQLAEMREYITHKRDCPVRTLVAPMSTPKEAIEKAARMRCTCRYFDLLDAAPAGGRVLWRAQGFLAHLPGGDSMWHCVAGEATLNILGQLISNGDQLATLTLREAPASASADEEWPKECPRCGAAGGSELGPCPMCKGTGFVDEDTEDA